MDVSTVAITLTKHSSDLAKCDIQNEEYSMHENAVH